jgi:hypothetical protein
MENESLRMNPGSIAMFDGYEKNSNHAGVYQIMHLLGWIWRSSC